jgi:hypothetical protein
MPGNRLEKRRIPFLKCQFANFTDLSHSLAPPQTHSSRERRIHENTKSPLSLGRNPLEPAKFRKKEGKTPRELGRHQIQGNARASLAHRRRARSPPAPLPTAWRSPTATGKFQHDHRELTGVLKTTASTMSSAPGAPKWWYSPGDGAKGWCRCSIARASPSPPPAAAAMGIGRADLEWGADGGGEKRNEGKVGGGGKEGNWSFQ